MTTGLRLRPAEQLLVSRARDFLAAGPADAVELVAHICQLPSPPRSVAEHMAMALLAPWDEFAHEGDGRWRLAPVVATQEIPAEAGAPVARPRPPRPGQLEARGGVNVEPDRLPTGGYPTASGTTASGVAERFGGRAGAAPVPRASEPLGDLSYVVVDVETTGGRPFAGDRITEIAAVVIQGGEITRVYETLVNPQRSIPPMITAITNITWEMVRTAPTFRDIVTEVTGVLRGHVFAAHNAGFDWRFVTSEIQRATGDRLEGRRLCTVRLARRLLPQLPRRSLDHVARYYGVEITARHRAGGDALATARVLLRLLADARDRGCSTWVELDTFLRTPTASRRRRRSAMPRPIDRDTTS